MKCEICGIADRTVLEVEYVVDSEKHQYCAQHLIDNGFCYLCGLFSAGLESYEFSPIEGVCGECVDMIKGETGEDDEYHEYDEY